ncbi:MAG: porin family protein [Bacteroidota bacterium]
MKLFSSFASLCLLYLFPQTLQGQPLPDFIVVSNQDTLWGEVRFNLTHPHFVKFIHATSGKVKNYRAENILSFSEEGVPYFPKTSENNSLPEFMKLVVQGYTNLWQASSGYFLEKEGKMIELKRPNGAQTAGSVNDKKFQGILKYNLSNCEAISWNAFDRLKYSQKEFAELISRYNKCIDPQGMQKNFFVKKRYIVLAGIEGGLTRTLVTWLEEDELYNITEENWGSRIVVGAFMELPISKRISGLIQLQYKQAETEVISRITSSLSTTRGQRNIYEFSFLDIPFSLKWKGVVFGKNSLFLQGGFLVGTALEKSNRSQNGSPTWRDSFFEEEDIFLTQTEQNTTRQGLQISGGYEYSFGKRSFIRISYMLEKSQYQEYRFTIQGMKLGVGL